MLPRLALAHLALLLASSAGLASAYTPLRRDYDSRDYYAVHLEPGAAVESFAAELGFDYEGPLHAVGEHHYIFSSPKQDSDAITDAVLDLRRRRKRNLDPAAPHVLDSVRFQQKQVRRQRLVKRSIIPPDSAPRIEPLSLEQRGFDFVGKLGIKDPIFPFQWHLNNPVVKGNDLNISGVWDQGITGAGSTVCIVDDGLDFNSKDLAANYFPAGSYDFNERVPEPLPRLVDDRHGTRCAGEVAAVRNDVCGVGVAYNSKISAVRILSKPITDVDEAESVVYGLEHNDIYSCSWGPPDDGKTMDGPGILIRKAMVRAVQEGRKGKGTVYVFAAGNGAQHGDNCNFDGYTNSIYSITVGAIDRLNQHPYYSEKCSAQLVVTYSSGSNDAIHTTDVGTDECTDVHGGTSAAGPLAAGVIALILQARPEVTWRDVQWLTVLTAVPFYDSSKPSEWQKTPLGVQYHHQFGYGKLDAYAIVEKAKTWDLVNKQAWYTSPWIPVYKPIPQGEGGVSSTFTITPDLLKQANLKRLEHVTVTMSVEHTRRGDISVQLTSPSKMVSELSTDRENDDAMVGYNDWTFMSVVHWGEDGIGEWKLTVKDSHLNEFTGNFTNWRLKLWGEAIDNKNQPLHPSPELTDDMAPSPESISASYTVTASVPASTSSAAASPTSPAATEATETPSPTADDQEEDEERPTGGFFSNPFPNMSISGGTKVWVYGALGLIVLFVISILVYFAISRRAKMGGAQKEADPEQSYAFALLNTSRNNRDDDPTERHDLLSRGDGDEEDSVLGSLDEAIEDYRRSTDSTDSLGSQARAPQRT